MKKEGLVSVTKSISGSVHRDWAKEWGTLEVQWQRNLQWKSKCTNKNTFNGFPMFLHLKILKQPF
jgi:hypothetical protein